MANRGAGGRAAAVPLTGSPFTGSNYRVNIAIDLSDSADNISGGAILNDVTLVLADPNAVASIDLLTINGSVGAPDARLSLVVANGRAALPTSVAFPSQHAITDFGTPSIPNAALRDPTRIAIAGKGNLAAALTAWHVSKLQFNGATVGSTYSGGAIQGEVTATAENGLHVTDTGQIDVDTNQPIFAAPIAYVRAGKKIAAPITATAGDIGIISIGTTEAATDGLRADVTAPAGSVRSIDCAGVVGDANATPAILPKIWARDNIRKIVVVENEGAQGVSDCRVIDAVRRSCGTRAWRG